MEARRPRATRAAGAGTGDSPSASRGFFGPRLRFDSYSGPNIAERAAADAGCPPLHSMQGDLPSAACFLTVPESRL